MREQRELQNLTDPGMAPKPSSFEDETLAFDQTVQIPKPFHAELLGISLLIISLLVAALTSANLRALNELVPLIQTPWKSKLPSLELSRRQHAKINADERQ